MMSKRPPDRGCLGETITGIDGTDYDCGYEFAGYFGCEDCMYGPYGIGWNPAVDPDYQIRMRRPRKVEK